jgi:peptidoglycan/LPS O-acetylase OafA/YrhL
MRDNNFNAIRLMLASAVIWSHAVPLLYGLEGGRREPIFRLTRGQASAGDLAVCGFFIVSGYLLAQSWQRRPAARVFLGRRARRLWPGFILAYFFSVVAVPWLAGDGFHRGVLYLPWLVHGTFLATLHTPLLPVFGQNPIPHNVNGSLWTLRYEWWCYVLLTTMGVLGALRRRVVIPGLIVALALVSCFGPHGAGLPTLPIPGIVVLTVGLPGEYPRLMACFLAGVVAHLYRDRLSFTRRGVMLTGGVLAATALLGHGLALVTPVCGGYLLLALGHAPTRYLARIGQRVDLSYGMYLYAFPVQQLLVRYAAVRLSPFTLAMLALAPTGALAWLSWHIIEQPALTGRWFTSPLRLSRRKVSPIGFPDAP